MPGRRRNAASWCWPARWPIPVDGGVLWFSAPNKEVVERFATDDPYVKGGLVTKWTVRAWTTVVGDAADASPDPPGERA